jgi:predicted KAP-like P-loop ATPase
MGCPDLRKYQPFDYNPKKSIDDDILCRKELVDAIYNLIVETDLSDSLTIGITGRWGSGKTTVINFLRDRLEKS